MQEGQAIARHVTLANSGHSRILPHKQHSFGLYWLVFKQPETAEATDTWKGVPDALQLNCCNALAGKALAH